MLVLEFGEETNVEQELDFVQVSDVEIDTGGYTLPISNEIATFIENIQHQTPWDSRQVADLYELLAQAIQLISLDQPATTLRELECVLEQLRSSVNFWQIPTHIDDLDARLWEGLILAFLKIPERFAAVFQEATSTVSNSRCFMVEEVKRLPDVQTGPLHTRYFNRVFSCSFADELYEALLVRDPEGDIIKQLLGHMDARRKVDAVVKLLHAASIHFDRLKQLVRYIINLNDAIDVHELLVDVVRYQPWQPELLSLYLSVSLWQMSSFNREAALAALLMSKKHNGVTFAAILTIMSFICQEELSENSELVRAIVDWITRRLNHAEPRVRLEGMILAELYGSVSGAETPLYFELDEDEPEVIGLRELSQTPRTVDFLMGVPCVPYKFQKPVRDAPVAADPVDEFSHVQTLPSIEAPPSTNKIVIGADRSERTSKIRQPRFLRDCTEYLRSEDPDKWELALEVLPEVIGTAFKLELKEFGLPLFKHLLFLSDQYKLPDFERKRMELMSTLLQLLPENSLRTLKSEFVGRSLNLGQKSDILTLIMTQLMDSLKGTPTKKYEIPDLFRELHITEKEDKLSSSATHNLVPVMIKHFYMPLLSELEDVQSRVFATAHDFLLEKTILCFALYMYSSGTSVEYPQMIGPLLRFLAPVFSNSQGPSKPIIQASLRAVHALFTSWPDYLDVTAYMRDFSVISQWMSELTVNPSLSSVLNETMCAFNNVVNPRRVLRDQANQGLSMQPKVVKRL